MPAHPEALSRERIGSRLMNGQALDRDDVAWVARQFDIGDIEDVSPFRHRGNINLDAFYVRDKAGGEYLLQRLNTEVFRIPERVMAAMEAWNRAQEAALKVRRQSEEDLAWEPIRLIPTRRGESFLDLSADGRRHVWRMMILIGDSYTCRSLNERPEGMELLSVAEEAGRGMALAADLTAGLDTAALEASLPGYRDTRGYFRQMHGVLRGCRSLDEAQDLLPSEGDVLIATNELYFLAIDPEEARRRRQDPLVEAAIASALAAEAEACSLQADASEGRIRRTAIHGDTKLENFLFCRSTHRVKCLVDLDTIMGYTWLADWGDMARSLCNVAGEMEADLELVQVDREVYAAVAKGFLSTVKAAPKEELERMPLAVEAIATELGIRFLTDYLRGDNYFRLHPDDPRDLNRTRGLVQLTLAQRLRELRPWAAELLG
jgi:hypothetical protein